MKTIANLIVLTSMFIGQFSGPYAPQSISSKNTPTATQTLVATATASGGLDNGTPTLPPTETITPISSETATPVPTSTEIPPAETVPPVEPAIAINLNATPGFVTPGGHITIDWIIEGISPADHELFLNIILPKGFTPTDKDVKFDQATLMLSIPVLKESGQFKIQADQITEDAVLLASLLEKETILAEVSLVLATKDQFILNSQGGEIQDSEGKIKLSFPENTFADEAVVQIGEPSGDDVPTYSLSDHPFSIKAQDRNSRASLHQFDTEVEIEVSYADLNIPTGKEENLFLYWYNPEIKAWEALPSSIDTETKTLKGTTSHFSVFDVGLNQWQAAHVPTVDAFQVSTFTGAGTFSLPIEVPAGPGGLQPNLTLSYNSQVVDQSTTTTQASWVGMGWSLETGSIERDMHDTPSDTGDDTFFLNVAGVSSRLVKDASGNYHPVDENFWKITFVNNIWTVWDKQGNIYSFGSSPNGNSISTGVYGSKCEMKLGVVTQQGGVVFLPYQWSLASVKNKFNQEITYSYSKEIKSMPYTYYSSSQMTCQNSTATMDNAIYPSIISYANGRYRVRFEREDRTDYPLEYVTSNAFAQHNFQRSRLEQIFVESDQDANGVFDLIRRYEFTYVDAANTTNLIYPGYTYTAGGKMSTLEKVTQYGIDDQTSLPATTFTYADNLHLTRANNGYGGGVQFNYEMWYYATDGPRTGTVVYNFGDRGNPCRTEGDPSPWTARAGTGSSVGCETDSRRDLLVFGIAQEYNGNTYPYARPGGVYKLFANFSSTGSPTVRLGINNGYQDVMTDVGVISGTPVYITLPATTQKAYPLIQVTGAQISVSDFVYQPVPTFYRVTQKTIFSGRPNESYSFSYSYINPADSTDSAAVNDADHSIDACPHSAPQDRNTLPENICTAVVETYSEFRGNKVVTVTGPDGAQTITTFAQDDARKGQVDKIARKSANGLTLQETINTATAIDLGISGYTPEDHWGFGHYWVHPASTETRIYAVGGSYTATNAVYEYESSYGNLLKQHDQSWSGSAWNTYRITENFYFPNNSPTRYLVSLPAKTKVYDSVYNLIGNTLAIMLYQYDGNMGSHLTTPADGKLTAVRTLVSGADFNQVSYAYDTWGNRISETTYSGYGTWTSAPTDGARTTTTIYDPVFHTYPISQTTPPTQNAAQDLTTSWAYDYDNNGIDDYILGVPTRETDPNGAQTRAKYDTFGRMTHVYRPDPISGMPVTTASLTMTYTDSYPFTTSITQHVNGYTYYTVTRVYDGMGRQTDSISYPGTAAPVPAISDGIYTETLYPSATVVKQSAPHSLTETPKYTTTTSNLNARTVTVASPDNTSTVTYTNGLTNTVTDARGNATTTTSDVWGRTISVVPPTGPGVTYQYDELNNMLTAIRGASTTTLTYDQAGRKTSMTDPDMGTWNYGYDALGNLTSQTDARSQRICMYYDSLNRLTGKYYPTNSSCDTPILNVTYAYDSGTNGKGRRTSMTDTSGATSWAYDARGRIKTETKTISGVTYATQWGYNLADLMTSTTYPDGEVVANTYDARMMLNGVSGTNSYVNSSQYDSAGRMTKRIYGNTTVTNYGYYPCSTANQGGRLSTIKSGLVDLNNPNTIPETLQSLQYSYDAAGNINTIVDARNASQKQCLQYDTLDRLIKATTYSDALQGCTSQAGSGNYNDTNSYNAVTGNLSFKTNVGNLQYNHAAHKHAVSYAGGNNYWYDANGNMTERTPITGSNYTFFYDAENRMTQVKQGTTIIATFTYDGDGKRVQSVINNVDTRFFGVVEIDDHGTQTPPPAPMFTDVPNGYWAKAHIEGLAKLGFVDSCVSSPLQYCPSTNITRLDAIKYIVKTKYGVNYTPPPASHYFVDMAGNPDEAWADQAYRDGITSGCTTNPRNFCPSNTITRAEIVIFLLRAKNGASYSPPAATHIFADMNGNWAEAWAEAAYNLGITSGCSTNPLNFCPSSYVTRASNAVFINNTFQLVPTAYSYSGTWHKYYFAGTQRVAMRTCSSTTCTAPTYFLSDHLGSTSLSVNIEGTMVSKLLYSPWGEVRSTTGTTATPYQYTAQFSNMSDFGLLFYNARWYDPAIGRFAQADSIVPPGVQGLDRYAYVNNSPMVYVDPSGHESVCGQANSDPECGNLGHSPLSHPSGGNTSNGNGGSGIILQQHHEADEGNTVYIGGATPAGIPGFEADGEGKYPPVEVFADWLEIVSMYSPNSPATLGVFLTYFTDTKGNVIKLELTIVNNGETSATLEYIDLSEETLPSFTSCTLNTTCHFKPQSPVNIDPGQVGSVTICQNCLADNTSTFSHPFNNNKYNRIGVKAALSMLIDWGYEGTRRSPIPFMYTIPRR